MFRSITLFVLLLLSNSLTFSQGLGIPSKSGGIGFGNLPKFTGVRLNVIDKDVERLAGLNVTVWQAKEESRQTGKMTGISLGVPMAMGTESMTGLGLGIFGVGATKNLSGINVGGLGVGAGGDVHGVSMGGLGVGTGGNLVGLGIGGLGVGAGKDVGGVNIGGLGVGAGENLFGLNVGGLGVGAGGNVSGITIGGLGVGAGGNVNGISVALVGVGSGGAVRGIAIGGVGVGSGTEVKGLAIAGIGVGSPRLRAIVIAPAAGGQDVSGLFIVPAYMKVGSKDSEGEIIHRGVSISAYNSIRGLQKGVTIGIVNRTASQKGFQIGLINIVHDNPRGLRVLPIFNMHFGGRTE